MGADCYRICEEVILKKSIRRLIYYLVYVFYLFSRILKFTHASYIGGIIGSLIYYIPLPARTLAVNNLKKAFPEKNISEIKRIARAAFKNQGRNLFELFSFESLTLPLLNKQVTFEGKDQFDAAFKNNKGVLILGAHFGNWELLGGSLSLWGYPINVIARKIYIEQINNLLVSLRNAAGVKVILRSDKGSAKNILRSIKNNEALGILIDQDTHVPSIWIDFFGHKAYTPSGLASLALKTNAAVVAGFIIREGDKHRVCIQGPLHIKRSGNLKQDIRDNTQMFTSIIEKYIRKYPEQWVWMHDRWKKKN